MAPVDIWFWVVTVVLAALIAMIIVGARRSRSRIDPTNVSIDPALAGRVRDLMAKGDKVKAVKELREATGLGLGDAIRIAEKMAPAKAAGGGASGRPKEDGAPAGPPHSSGGGDGDRVLAGIGPDHLDELRDLVAAGQQSAAVTMVRELTGLPLADAKAFVDRL
jgi:ribosomal protein L7/L12